MGTRGRLWILAGLFLAIISFILILFIGSVAIPFPDIISILTGGESAVGYYKTIVLETRLPMAIAATCCGATLSVAGLMMQTVFQNPLAGPSVLGVSSGASLGVALLTLSAGGLGGVAAISWLPAISTLGAMAGAIAIIFVLLAFSNVLKNGVSLLIVGVMISYLCSAAISLLNFLSPPDEIRSYLVWGLGSFSNLRLNGALWLSILTIISIIPAIFYIKPLNSLLSGEHYAMSIGYSMKRLRFGLLIFSGVLVAIPTAFCGPIGFIGLVVPHLCRLVLKTSNHTLLMPACIIFGALATLLCAIIEILPSRHLGTIPINVITPFVGVPVILYLLVNRKKILYFS